MLLYKNKVAVSVLTIEPTVSEIQELPIISRI